MKIEVCDLCHARVHDMNKTEVIIKDHKGFTLDYGTALPTTRKFRGVVCDDCLILLRKSKTVKDKEK